MLQANELYYLQYLMMFPAEWRSPMSDYYMKTADSKSGKAFVLKDDEEPVAYAVLVRENQGWILKYIYTDRDKRRMGYASYLIREIILRTEKYVRVHIVHSHPFYNAIAACLNKLGFVINDTSCVYSVTVGNSLWERVDELNLVSKKGFLLRGGAVCIPFCEMSDSIREQLINSSSNSFGNTLNPAPLLQNKSENVDSTISTVLVKNGELKAYTLITRPSRNSISLEHISEAQSEIGSGRIVAPLCASFEAIRKHPEITMMKLTISDSNKRSYRFVMRMLESQEIGVTKNTSYIITKEMLK